MTDGQPASPAPGRRVWAALAGTTFRSLRHRDYRLYFLGQMVSFTGSWMQSAALMWLMFDRTGDPRWPSWLLVAQVGPTVLLGTWGGNLADRLPKRWLIVRTQVAFLFNAAVLAVVVALDAAPPWAVLALQCFNGVVQAVDLPARLAFVPELVPKSDLVNAVGLNALLFNSARAVGPAAAGLLFLLAAAAAPAVGVADPVRLGTVACMGLNAVSFVAVVAALRALSVAGDPPPRPADGRSFAAGVRYLVDHPRYGGLVLLTLALCVFAWPVLTVLPAYTRDVLRMREQAYSLLVSVVGAGALAAALATATFGGRRRRVFLAAGAWCAAGGLAGLTAAGSLAAAVGFAAVTGFGLILYLSTGQATLQLAVPDAVRGRVLALWAMTLSASAPLGHLLAGESVARFGVTATLAAMAAGVAVIAVGLVGVVVRRR